MIDLSHPHRLPPTARRLAESLPGHTIGRDMADPDRPLLRLLLTLADPLDDLSAAIDQLFGDHFVETASEEALPFLAELVGTAILRHGAPANRALIARAVHWLRRKGLQRTLEEIVTAASGWSAEAEEAYRSLLVTQDLNHLALNRGRTMVTWDPVAAADPLSRRAPLGGSPHAAVPDAALIEALPGEDVEDTLRRLGRVDAGRIAVGPRSLDLNGPSMPHIALVRTSRFADARVEDRALGSLTAPAGSAERGVLRTQPHTERPDIGFVLAPLDPAGGIERTAWDAPMEGGYDAPAHTEAHEPDPSPQPPRLANRLLTPTALAADGDAVEAGGALALEIDGVILIGPPTTRRSSEAAEPLAFAPVVTTPVLRFADARRPSPADRWTLRLVALDPGAPDRVPDTVLANVPLGEASDENPATLEVLATKGSEDIPTEGPAARALIGGHVTAVRIVREALDIGYRRNAAGDWSTEIFGPAGGRPASRAVALDDGGTVRFARIETRAPDDFGVAVLSPDDGPGWSFAALDLSALAPGERPDTDAPNPGPWLELVAAGMDLLIVGADENEMALGLWRVTDPMGTPAIARLDAAPQTRPVPRLLPSAVSHGGAVFVYGGETEDGRTLADLWSLDPDAGSPTWQLRPARLPREGREDAPRMGGTLLSTPSGPVLIGGAARAGILSPMVMQADLSGARPRWHRLPDLPLAAPGPGVLWARADGDDIEALVWDDSTAPRLMRLAESEGRWRAGPSERAGDVPNPPADGEAVFVGDDFVVLGPPPLPPSEVIVSAGPTARIGFLPALDITAVDGPQLFTLSTAGDATRWVAPGEPLRPSLRLGAGLAAPALERIAPQPRVGAVERLGWRPLALRQRSLGPWDDPLALELDDCVGFDPRLGRIALRRELAFGRLSLTHRIARADAIGPGFANADLPPEWQDPGTEPPAGPSTLLTASHIDPLRLGELTEAGGTFVADLAVAAATGGRNVTIVGSPRLAPTWLRLTEASHTVIGTGSPAHVPFIDADDDGVSLSVREEIAPANEAAEGPSLWLANLVLGGALELHLSAGRVDLAYVKLGAPGAPGVTALGAGLQSPLTLSSLPEPTLEIVLTGCTVGTLVVPPWARVTAAGCTFDAGDEDADAIIAPGARVTLRHVTVRGRTRAGILEASSCVFAGAVVCDRTRRGYARYSVLGPGGRPPLLYESDERPPSLAGVVPGTPAYLTLGENNDAALLSRGESRRTPGAHASRSGRLLEAVQRTVDVLPMRLAAAHVDRTRASERSMNRRSP